MASQTINLLNSWFSYDAGDGEKIWRTTNVDDATIFDDLLPPGVSGVDLDRVEIHSDGGVELRFTDGSQTLPDEDLSNQFETRGSFTLTVGSNSVTIEMSDLGDTSDPYTGNPSAGRSDRIAFYNAIGTSSLSGTLVLDDGLVNATQTIPLPSSRYSTMSGSHSRAGQTVRYYLWPSNRPQIDSALSPPGQARYLYTIFVWSNGDIGLNLENNASGTVINTNNYDLSDSWENDGSITWTHDAVSITLNAEDANPDEDTYEWRGNAGVPIYNSFAAFGRTLTGTLTITSGSAPPPTFVPVSWTATGGSAQSWTSGTAITPLVVPIVDEGTAPVTYSVIGLPAGLTFNSSTRRISGAPTSQGATSGTITITASNVDGSTTHTDTYAYTYTISLTPPPPPTGGLPDSGLITLLDIAEEFNPSYSGTQLLSEYRAGGSYVASGTVNGAGDSIPGAVGTIWLTDFYGSSASTSTSVSRSRTFYQLSASSPQAPTSDNFSDYTSLSNWSTSPQTATTSSSVWRVTLTQNFSSMTHTEDTWDDDNIWSEVTLYQSREETTLYYRGTSAPPTPAGSSPSGWGTSPNSSGQCVWQSTRTTVTTEGTSVVTWSGVTKLTNVAAQYPVPIVSVQYVPDETSGSIEVTISPPTSGWNGPCGGAISGSSISYSITGLITNESGTATFNNGFSASYPEGEFTAGSTITATASVTYSDNGESAEVSDSASSTGTGPVTTTTTIERWARATSAPSKPASTVENPGSPWTFTSAPDPTTTLDVYKLTWTRTYSDGNFQSADGSVSLSADRTGISTEDIILYQRSTSTTFPLSPSSTSSVNSYNDRNGRAPWITTNQGATTQHRVYQITLTQHFNSSTIQNSGTWDRNVWGSVSLEEDFLDLPSVTAGTVSVSAPTTGGTGSSVRVSAVTAGGLGDRLDFLWEIVSGGGTLSSTTARSPTLSKGTAGAVVVKVTATWVGLGRPNNYSVGSVSVTSSNHTVTFTVDPIYPNGRVVQSTPLDVASITARYMTRDGTANDGVSPILVSNFHFNLVPTGEDVDSDNWQTLPRSPTLSAELTVTTDSNGDAFTDGSSYTLHHYQSFADGTSNVDDQSQTELRTATIPED